MFAVLQMRMYGYKDDCNSMDIQTLVNVGGVGYKMLIPILLNGVAQDPNGFTCSKGV